MSAPCPAPGIAGFVPLSAQQLHEAAHRAFCVGNRGRLSLCESLRVFAETRLHFDLGFPDVAAYADAFFQMSRAESYEHVRVARSLLELTDLRDGFVEGKIGWSVLKAVSLVASVDTQGDWMEFAARHGGERTTAEARDARRRGRDKPRDASFGLPNLDQKLVLRFSRSEMEKVRAWIEHARASAAERTGAQEISIEQALLFLCEKSESLGPRRSRVVYQRCPDCRRGRMGTREGFVEVSEEEIERHEGCAEAVVIDGPTPPKMRRTILSREADRCANPRCGNRADHCHHIRFRSEGGETRLSNQVAVCSTCHSLVHAGLLKVTGSAPEELSWAPVGAPDSFGSSSSLNRAASDRPVDPSSAGLSSAGQSSNEDSESHGVRGTGVDLQAPAQGER